MEQESCKIIFTHTHTHAMKTLLRSILLKANDSYPFSINPQVKRTEEKKVEVGPNGASRNETVN